MNLNVVALRFEDDAFSDIGSRCKTCGETFKTPLLVKGFSDSVAEEYYACPRCLSKVASLHNELEAEEVCKADDQIAEPLEAEILVESKVKGTGNCMHHLGYLKQRGKSTTIPEECLTCSKIIDCM